MRELHLHAALKAAATIRSASVLDEDVAAAPCAGAEVHDALMLLQVSNVRDEHDSVPRRDAEG